MRRPKNRSNMWYGPPHFLVLNYFGALGYILGFSQWVTSFFCNAILYYSLLCIHDLVGHPWWPKFFAMCGLRQCGEILLRIVGVRKSYIHLATFFSNVLVHRDSSNVLG